MSKFSNCCFTLNNYTNENEEQLKLFSQTHCYYMVYGHEEGEETHTPHLQGFIQLKNRMKLQTIKNKLGINSIHLENIKGTVQDNINYCTKDGTNNYVYGEPSIAGSNKLKKENLRQLIKECKTWREVLEIEGIEKYLKFAREYFNNLDRRDKTIFQDIKLYDWQEQLINWMDREGNCRDILIVMDKTGGKGKSFFCSYCQIMRDDTFISSIGKTADILYIYKDNIKKNILLDTPRDSKFDTMNWQLVECITNYSFTSTKYEPQTITKSIRTNTILFTNDTNYKEVVNHLSKDRIYLMNLDKIEDGIQSYKSYKFDK